MCISDHRWRPPWGAWWKQFLGRLDCILYSTCHSSLPEKKTQLESLWLESLWLECLTFFSEPKCDWWNYNYIHTFLVGFHGNRWKRKSYATSWYMVAMDFLAASKFYDFAEKSDGERVKSTWRVSRKWFSLISEGGHSLFFSSSLAFLPSSLSCRWKNNFWCGPSWNDIVVTVLAFRRLTIIYVQSANVPL